MKKKKDLTTVDKTRFIDELNQAIIIALSFDSSSPLKELSNYLYIHWYIKPNIKKPDEPLPHSEWAEVFRAVHHGSYCWENGWRVLKVSSAGRVVVVQEEEERMLYPGDYISLGREGLPPAIGAEIEVVSRRDSTEEQPGFWIAYSRSWYKVSTPLIRIYWNINPEGAVHLVREISEKLSDDIPYSFKVPVDSIGYRRADVAVLYFEANKFNVLKDKIKSIYEKMAPFLYPDIPGFTKILEPGLGLAEDPLEEYESFGSYRCRLIAEGYHMAVKHHRDDFLAIKLFVTNYLEEQEIILTHPYLNAGGEDEYEW